MAKLTDDDIEQLLRETFADKENLVDELPSATKRRSPGPVLLAAAAVLVVLAGVLYAVNRAGDPDAVSPAGQVSPTVRFESDDAMIWAKAIQSMLRQVTPGQGWKTVFVLVSLFHDCNHWTWAEYRIEKHGTWVVTATLDQRTQTW